MKWKRFSGRERDLPLVVFNHLPHPPTTTTIRFVMTVCCYCSSSGARFCIGVSIVLYCIVDVLYVWIDGSIVRVCRKIGEWALDNPCLPINEAQHPSLPCLNDGLRQIYMKGWYSRQTVDATYLINLCHQQWAGTVCTVSVYCKQIVLFTKQ